ncbi:hypothetical protein N7507_009316 [Penicillium longicatenatum]|nr:hypothetical protein N7507_009316 [Penicillium longicatenatum]
MRVGPPIYHLSSISNHDSFSHTLDGSADPKEFDDLVVGGHSEAPILPFSSLAQLAVSFSDQVPAEAINRGDEIVQSKKGAGSATTYMANADFRSVKATVAGMNGKHVVEEAIVYLLGVVGGSEIARKLDVDYIAVKIALGVTGATEALPIENISENQMKLLQVAIRGIKINIETGVSFMSQ